jgi:hypothetical protein
MRNAAPPVGPYPGEPMYERSPAVGVPEIRPSGGATSRSTRATWPQADHLGAARRKRSSGSAQRSLSRRQAHPDAWRGARAGLVPRAQALPLSALVMGCATPSHRRSGVKATLRCPRPLAWLGSSSRGAGGRPRRGPVLPDHLDRWLTQREAAVPQDTPAPAPPPPEERPRVPWTAETSRVIDEMQEAEDRHWRHQEGDFGPDSRVVAYYSPGLEPVGPERFHEPLRRAGRAFTLADRRAALRRRILCAQSRPRGRRGRAPRRRAVRRRTTSRLDPPEPGEGDDPDDLSGGCSPDKGWSGWGKGRPR